MLSFATLSDGTDDRESAVLPESSGNPRLAQRRVSRRSRGSHTRRKAIQLLQKAHVHVRNQRADFHHKTAQALVQHYGVIAVEALNVRCGLAGGMLAKSVN